MKHLKKSHWLIISSVIAVLAIIIVKFSSSDDLTPLLDHFVESNQDNMCVYFIDVGDADSIYIEYNGSNILIDSGEKKLSNKVFELLKQKNVQKLDLVIATHPHTDHIGNMAEIINRIQIDRFYMPQLKENVLPPTKTYEKMLLSLTSKNIIPEAPVPGKTIQISDMQIDFLAPNKDYDDVNNYSIVTKITFGKTKFLFTGDAEKLSETDMLTCGYDVTANVLKVGHHGSKTSTSQAFLNKVNPQIAVISSAPYKHSHPHKSVLNRLTNRGIRVLRTDLDGTILIKSDGENLKINTEKSA